MNWESTRTEDHSSCPKGRRLPFWPGAKLIEATYWWLSFMSYTQCAAVTTCFGPINVPVHSKPLRPQKLSKQGYIRD